MVYLYLNIPPDLLEMFLRLLFYLTDPKLSYVCNVEKRRFSDIIAML